MFLVYYYENYSKFSYHLFRYYYETNNVFLFHKLSWLV